MVRAQVDHLVDRPQVQARRRAQPSGTNSPSSSHPRWKAPSAMRHLRSVPAMRPPGSPRCGVPGRLHTSEPRGSAPRERDHRGGDHPVPSRTRQLSPPSPRVLQREAAGGQGVALAEGAFLYAPRRPAGEVSPAGLFAFWGGRGVASGVARDAGRFMRREASAWFTGSAPGCAEGCYPRGVYLRFGDANA